MKSYVVSQISDDDVKLFQRIQRVIDEFSDIRFGKDENGEEIVLSCHILARAVGKVFGLKCIDGYFYPNFEHTWLLTPDGNIIDVYPVAVLGGPILMDGQHCSPARWLYKKKRLALRNSKNLSFRRAVRIAIAAINKIM